MGDINDLGQDWVHACMVNVRPKERSDNGMLITVEYMILAIAKIGYVPGWVRPHLWAVVAEHTQDFRHYAQVPWRPLQQDPASHDNDMTMLCLCYALGMVMVIDEYRMLKKRKVSVFGKTLWVPFPKHPHPRDIATVMWLKGGWRRALSWLTLMWPLMIAYQFVSCYRATKVRGEMKFAATDTKKLVWVKCQCLRGRSWVMEISWRLCRWALRRNDCVFDSSLGDVVDISTFEKSFSHYYCDGHPNTFFPEDVYETLPNWESR